MRLLISGSWVRAPRWAKFFCNQVLWHRQQKCNCRDPGSNRGPLDLQSNALPTELSRLMQIMSNYFSPHAAFKSPCAVRKQTCLPKTDREWWNFCYIALDKHCFFHAIPRGLTARISGFHPGGPGSTPGVGTILRLRVKTRFLLNLQDKTVVEHKVYESFDSSVGRAVDCSW